MKVNYAVKLLSAVLLIGAMSTNSKAQTTVTLGGEGTITCGATPTATWTTPPTGVTFSNLTRGSGVTCSSGNNGINGYGFTDASASAANTAGDYYTVTITADATHNFTLNSIAWVTQCSGSIVKRQHKVD